MATWAEVGVAVVALFVNSWLQRSLARKADAHARQLAIEAAKQSQRQSTETLRAATEDQTRRQIAATRETSAGIVTGLEALAKRFDSHETDDRNVESQIWTRLNQHVDQTNRELSSVASTLAAHNERIKSFESARK